MTLLTLLSVCRVRFSLALVVVSLCYVTVSSAQELPLDDFVIPEEKESQDDEVAPEDVQVEEPAEAPTPAVEEDPSDAETPDADNSVDSVIKEFLIEDTPDEADAVDSDNDLTVFDEGEEDKGDDALGLENADQPENEIGNDADSEDAVDDLQPIPIPESVAEPEAEEARASSERVPGVKRPSSWLTRGGMIGSHWVRLSSTGELRGEINVLQTNGPEQAVASAKVAIYRNGKRVGEDVTNKSGQFSFREVKSGVYSLLVSGSDGFAAYGVHVLGPREQSLFEKPARKRASSSKDNDEPSSENLEIGHKRPHDDFVQFAQIVRTPPPGVKVKETLRISTAAVPSTSFGPLRSIIQDYGKSLTEKDRVPPEALPRDAWDDLIATAIKEKKPGFDEPEGPEMYRGTKELERNPVRHVRSPALGNFNVPLERCGDGLVLCGRMVDTDTGSGRPLEVAEKSTTLTLIRGDQRVATTVVRAGGDFEFRSVTPGIYSIVAVGDVGFGAISFNAVAPQEQAVKSDEQAGRKKSNIHLVQHSLGGVMVEEPLNDVIVDQPLNGVIVEEPLNGVVIQDGGVIVEDDGCCCCGPAGGVSSNTIVGGNFGGGVNVPLCCDPAAKRDAVGFFRPLLAAAGVIVPAVALATDDPPVEFGAPVSSGGFQGTAGGFSGGGGGIGLGLGAGAIGVGIAAALDDDDPVSPVTP